MTNIRIMPVVTGVSVSILGSLILGIVLFFLFRIGGVTSQNDTQPFQVIYSMKFMVIYFILGVAADFISGLIAGIMARTAEIIHSSLVGVIISLLIGIELVFSTTSSYPLWLTWMGFIITIPTTVAGGFASKKVNERGYSLSKLKRYFDVLNFIIFLLLMRIISLAVVSISSNKYTLPDFIEITLGVLIVIGLIKKINYARVFLIFLLGLEIILYLPSMWSNILTTRWSDIITDFIFIIIRVAIIYYLRKNSTKLAFAKAKKGMVVHAQ